MTSRSCSYSALLALAYFIMLSYALSNYADSCFFNKSASFNYLRTTPRLAIIYCNSGTTSILDFSNKTPLTKRQHRLSSSSFDIESSTSLIKWAKSLTHSLSSHLLVPLPLKQVFRTLAVIFSICGLLRAQFPLKTLFFP